MEKIGIIYWPKEGSVEKIAKQIYDKINTVNVDIFDILSIETTDLVNYDCLIMGGSTVGAEVWQDADANNKWNVFFSELDKLNLKNKDVAIFGLGNQILYPNNFVDGMAVIRDEFEKRGAQIIGKWSTEGYTFTDSLAVENKEFIGLAIDEDQQADLTEKRIESWLTKLESESNC